MNYKILTTSSSLDSKVINELIEISNYSESESLITDLSIMYLDQSLLLYNELVQSWQKNDFKKASSFAHKLKGLSLNIGAKKLASYFEIIEIENMSNISYNTKIANKALEELRILRDVLSCFLRNKNAVDETTDSKL